MICTRSFVHVRFHWYAFVFTHMCLFLLVQVRSSSYTLVLTRYGFILARSRYMFHSCSFAFILICSYSFSVVQVHFSVYAFIFMCTRLFSCVCVRFHSYMFILTCTGPFTVVHVCLSYSQWYVLIFSGMHLFSVGHSFFRTCFQLDALILSLRIHSQFTHSFSVYTFILSGTHSFSVGCTCSWLDTLVLGCTHLF